MRQPDGPRPDLTTITGRDLKMFECDGGEYVQVMSRTPRTETMKFVLSGAKPVR